MRLNFVHDFEKRYKKITAMAAVALLLLIAPPVWAGELADACAAGDADAVRALLADGAAPDEPDGEGYTPLLRTVFAGEVRPLSAHLEIAELLLDAGADVNASADVLPPDDANPVRTAAALHRTVTQGTAFLEFTLLLLERGADPNLPGAWGAPLHAAAASDKAGAGEVEVLLGHRADAKSLNQWGVEPLAEAVTAADPSPQKIALLLEAGGDVNVIFDWGGHRGINALMAAAMNGSSDTVRLLLDNGAQKYSVSGDGLTPYDYAVMAGRADNAFALR